MESSSPNEKCTMSSSKETSGFERKCVGVLFALLIASVTRSRTTSASTPKYEDVCSHAESHIDVSLDSSRMKSSSVFPSSHDDPSSSQSTTRLFQDWVICLMFMGGCVRIECSPRESRSRSNGSTSC